MCIVVVSSFDVSDKTLPSTPNPFPGHGIYTSEGRSVTLSVCKGLLYRHWNGDFRNGIIKWSAPYASADPLAAGVASLPNQCQAFAATQAAWRFLNNDRVNLPALVEPLQRSVGSGPTPRHRLFVMLVYDWSKLTYHPGRAESGKQESGSTDHSTDVG